MNRIAKLGFLMALSVMALTGCKDPENKDNNVDIKVTTYVPTEITSNTALCGGHVTVTGEAVITELGVCWSTDNNPVATDSHLSTSIVNEPFNCTITELQPEMQYHVRAYALYESEYHYGEDVSFTTLADNGGGGNGGDEPDPGPNPENHEGLLQGLFSVSETLQVRFSQGNLQYQVSTNTWRFAESQISYVGEDNANVSENYDGWIDLFGWGTSGYNHGANAYQPWSTSTHYADYYAYGSYTNSLFGQSGQADWGYNPISNGGNTENSGWRTLQGNEWEYLMEKRSTSTDIRFATACVAGTNGVLIFPDNWDGSCDIANPNRYASNFEDNTITAADWENLEAKGVVILPAAGLRVEGTQMVYVQTGGVYWASTASSNDLAYTMYFVAGEKLRGIDANNRELGASVRLVMDSGDR